MNTLRAAFLIRYAASAKGGIPLAGSSYYRGGGGANSCSTGSG